MIELERYPDWPNRLNKFLIEARNRKFEWGEFDCCIWAASAVEAITGVDPMPEFRKQYHDEESAKIALREIGSGTLYNTLKAKFGEPVNGARGQRGDIGYYEKACGVIYGKFCMFFGQEGWVRVPVSRLDSAFKVGWNR